MLKSRLDQELINRGLVETRAKAKALILGGRVRVNGETVTKASKEILPQNAIELIEGKRFVSRGGEKLAGALDFFKADLLPFPSLSVAMDIGASTGGFSDCLLQHGMSKIYAVDVGYNQLDFKLRCDPRMVVLERQNIRYLVPEKIPEKVDLVVIDVSFISVLKFLDHITQFMKDQAMVLVLIKPQFEGQRDEVGKGGIIRDQAKVQEIVERFIENANKLGLIFRGKTPSVIQGAKGNQEWFALFCQRPAVVGVEKFA